MTLLENILKKFSLIILDGALATELERRGCNINDSLWSAKVLMENPDLIREVHEDYFASGADCAITASYQATIEGFVKRGLSEDEAKKLIAKSVQIAIQARDNFWGVPDNRSNRPRPIVAASVGPYGAFLADGSEYRGDYNLNEEELMDFHRIRMKTLITEAPDILACETIPCLKEAKAIVRLLKEFPGTYAWVSFSAKNDLQISSGENIAECAAWLNNYEQIAAIGVNCTSPQYIPSLIREIRSKTDKPIIVYPNSGEQYDADSKIWCGHSSDETFGDSAKNWYGCGASLIGGCCRTNPDDIREIAAWARSL